MNQQLPSHGGYGKKLGAKLDFSAGINPLGMPERVKKAVIDSAADWDMYPDPGCDELRELIAGRYHTDPGLIVCGNGADDLIYRIVSALKPEKALIPVPAFGEYEKALRQQGSVISYHILKPENDFDAGDGFIGSITSDTDIIFFCNPNNPTGRLCSRDYMERVAVKASECAAVIVIDESFMDFAKRKHESSMAGCGMENVIVLGSFTKIYAMAGLRLGYALFGNASLCRRVCETGQYWSVSAAAEAAGRAALKEDDYVRETVSYIASERDYFEKGLAEAGIRYIRSAASFILIYSEAPLYDMLLGKGILVRDCRNFPGLGKGWYRIAVRTHEENVQLMQALDEICKA